MKPILLATVYSIIPLIMFGCGAQMDKLALDKAKAITCESLLRVYYEAVDSGVEIEPEERAIVEECL